MKKLTPSAVTPASIMARKPSKKAKLVKKQIADIRNSHEWALIHHDVVNATKQTRRPVRALESYLDNAPVDVFHGTEFTCALSRLRNELKKVLVLSTDDDEMRQTFFINDIANYTRIFQAQSGSQNFLYKINPPLPKDPQADPSKMKMILTYRGIELALKQAMDGEITHLKPYGALLLRGAEYDNADPAVIEWCGKSKGPDAFYMTIEPAASRLRSRL